MIAKIDLTGKQVARINSNPNVYRHAGAQLMGEQLVGNEALRKALKDWITESGGGDARDRSAADHRSD